MFELKKIYGLMYFDILEYFVDGSIDEECRVVSKRCFIG